MEQSDVLRFSTSGVFKAGFSSGPKSTPPDDNLEAIFDLRKAVDSG